VVERVPCWSHADISETIERETNRPPMQLYEALRFEIEAYDCYPYWIDTGDFLETTKRKKKILETISCKFFKST
jgi:hypothetical protein